MEVHVLYKLIAFLLSKTQDEGVIETRLATYIKRITYPC
jgi:hypothetical protein